MTVPRYLLDTNICIYLRQNRPASVFERFRLLEPGAAVISVVTFGELTYGAEKSHRRELSLTGLQRLLTFLPVLPVPLDAGSEYGRIRASLERQGNMISGNDLWIASNVMAAGLTLVTNNEREFRRVEGLAIENWVAAA